MNIYDMYRFACTYGTEPYPHTGCSEPREIYEVDINDIIKFTFIGSSHAHRLVWRDWTWDEGKSTPFEMNILIEAVESWLGEFGSGLEVSRFEKVEKKVLDDFDKLLSMLEEEREPTPALLRAGKRYKELVGKDMKDTTYRKHNDRSMNSSTYHKKDGTATRQILKREAQAEVEEMNPKVTWFLEDTVFEENIDALKAELTRQGVPFETAKYVPFESGTYKDPKGAVLFYGSLNLMRQFLREKSWVPCGWCTLDNFKCSTYYTYFGKFLLSQNYLMMPALELLRQKEWVYDKMAIDGCVFVRPSSGFKEFAGAVVPLEEMNENALGFGFYHENPELLTVVTSPKVITKEWRFIVATQSTRWIFVKVTVNCFCLN